jgi:hypothetical protein
MCRLLPSLQSPKGETQHTMDHAMMVSFDTTSSPWARSQCARLVADFSHSQEKDRLSVHEEQHWFVSICVSAWMMSLLSRLGCTFAASLAALNFPLDGNVSLPRDKQTREPNQLPGSRVHADSWVLRCAPSHQEPRTNLRNGGRLPCHFPPRETTSWTAL